MGGSSLGTWRRPFACENRWKQLLTSLQHFHGRDDLSSWGHHGDIMGIWVCLTKKRATPKSTYCESSFCRWKPRFWGYTVYSVCIYVYTCIYIYICLCIYLFIYIYIHHFHTLAQSCHCEFCCEMHLTCKNTNNQMTRWIYIHIYNITGDDDDIKQQGYNIGPPSCDLNAPRGGTIYIYI